MKYLLTLIAFLCFSIVSFSQVYSNREVGKKNIKAVDSLKATEYPYALPIWGDKATKLGFDLPYSAGVSVQYFFAESDILISDLSVGFNNNPMQSVSDIIRFDVAKSKASSLTFRPDVWLFPFLNVYGILGKSQASTEVKFQVWDPRDNTPIGNPLSTTVEFNTTTFGLGLTPTIGVGGGFMALDMNVAWTDVPQLTKPARSFIFGPRLGKNFKLKKPGQSVAFWVGGFRVKIAGETAGSLSLSEVFPEDGQLDEVIDGAIDKNDQAQQDLEDKWNSLSDAQKVLLEDYYQQRSQRLAEREEFLTQADQAVSDAANSTVQYSMTKEVKDMWNFIVGGQYTFSKHLMIRAEYGFLGSRTQIITGLQYRFGL